MDPRGNRCDRNRTPKAQLPLTFEEGRKRKLCMKCAVPWVPGHHCAGRNIRNHVYNRIRQGHHHTHIIGELLGELETDNAMKLEHEIWLPDGDPQDTQMVEEEINEIESMLGRNLLMRAMFSTTSPLIYCHPHFLHLLSLRPPLPSMKIRL